MEQLYNLRDNSSIEEAIPLIEELIGLAEHTIYLVSGNLNAAIYGKKEITDALEKAAGEKVKIEIIVGPEVDKRSTKLLELCTDGKIALYQLPERPRIHFMTVDNKHARIEHYHEPGAESRRARVRKDTTILAQRLETDFAKLKSKAERL